MAKRKKSPPTYTPSRTEQAVKRRPRAHAHECPVCGQLHGSPHADRTERMLAVSDDPLIAYMRLHEWRSEGEAPPLDERFLSFLDQDPSQHLARKLAIQALLLGFTDHDAALALIVARHLLFDERAGQLHPLGLSNREQAHRLGVSHPTVATMIDHGKRVLQEIAWRQGLIGR